MGTRVLTHIRAAEEASHRLFVLLLLQLKQSPLLAVRVSPSRAHGCVNSVLALFCARQQTAAAAEEAAAKSAAASASVAAEGAAQAEENSLVEALREVHGALMTAQEDGAEVERVAAGVGLASALLGSLRALKRRGSDGGGSESGWRLAKEVSWMSSDIVLLWSCCFVNFGRC